MKKILAILSIIIVVFTIVVASYVNHQMKAVEDYAQEFDNLKNIENLKLSSVILDRGGKNIGEFSSENRYFIPYKNIPPYVVQAFISTEDQSFFSHNGVSLKGILRATIANLKNGSIVQGASTITQQLARINFLNNKRSFTRKIREVSLALAMEKHLSKEKIMELYLNQVFLGNHSFGIDAAAHNYFQKRAQDLTLGEAAMLAGLPKAPSRYAPHRHYDRAKRRQISVLKRMYEDKTITKKELSYWIRKKLKITSRPTNTLSPSSYYVQMVKQELSKKFELSSFDSQGLIIHTTIDHHLQTKSQEELSKELIKLNMTRKTAKDHFEGAFISLNPQTGAILALQGGSNFYRTQFNRALNTKRELGSLFIPILSSIAIDNNYSLAHKVDLSPASLKPSRKIKSFPSILETMLNESFENSIILLASLGVPNVYNFSKRFGFNFNISDLRLGLGRGLSTPIQVSSAYSTFINGGYKIRPYLISKVLTRSGKILYQRGNSYQKQIIKESTAKIIAHALNIKDNKENSFYTYTAQSEKLRNGWFISNKNNLQTTLWVGSEKGRLRLASNKDKISQHLNNIWNNLKTELPMLKFHKKQNTNLSFTPLSIKDKNGKNKTMFIPISIKAPQQAIRF